MQPDSQPQVFIVQSLNAGLTPEAITTSLRQSGWSDADIQEALMIVTHARKRRNRAGVFWLLLPFITLVAVLMLQLAAHALNIHSALINIISLLAFPVSLVVGLVKGLKALGS